MPKPHTSPSTVQRREDEEDAIRKRVEGLARVLGEKDGLGLEQVLRPGFTLFHETEELHEPDSRGRGKELDVGRQPTVKAPWSRRGLAACLKEVFDRERRELEGGMMLDVRRVGGVEPRHHVR